MSTALACLALAASLPLAAIGWIAGAVLDRAETSPGRRYRLWEAAFWSVPIAAGAVLTAPWLPVARLRMVLHSSAAHAPPLPFADTSAHLQAPSPMIIVLAIAVTGMACRLAGLALRLRRLRDVERRATGRLGDLAGLPVRLSEDLDSPVLAGLGRHTILLPARFAEPRAARAAALVCRHEAAHAARGDNLRVLLEEAALAILWFNPVLVAVRSRLSAAREEVCDAVALADLGSGSGASTPATCSTAWRRGPPTFLPPAWLASTGDPRPCASKPSSRRSRTAGARRSLRRC